MPLLFLIGYPLAEVAIALGVASLVGWWPVIIAQFAGLAVGAALLRRAPVSAVLLAIPGFLTDVIGLLLLIPSVRRLVASTAVSAAAARLGVAVPPRGGSTMAPPAGEVVRGEVLRESDDEDR